MVANVCWLLASSQRRWVPMAYLAQAYSSATGQFLPVKPLGFHTLQQLMEALVKENIVCMRCHPGGWLEVALPLRRCFVA